MNLIKISLVAVFFMLCVGALWAENVNVLPSVPVASMMSKSCDGVNQPCSSLDESSEHSQSDPVVKTGLSVTQKISNFPVSGTMSASYSRVSYIEPIENICMPWSTDVVSDKDN